MKIILDTNVFMSGIFFGGAPDKILDAILEGKFELIVSTEIFAEYQDVVKRLANKYSTVEIESAFNSIIQIARVIAAEPLKQNICSDPDDDKFLACASSSKSACIITGDKALLALNPFANTRIITPRQFIKEFM